MYGVVVELWPDPVNRQIYYQLPAICHTVYKYTWLDNYGMWAGQTFINGPSPWRLVVISNVILKGGDYIWGNETIQSKFEFWSFFWFLWPTPIRCDFPFDLFSDPVLLCNAILSDSVLRWHVESVCVRRVRVGLLPVVHLLLSNIRCRRRRKEWLHRGRKKTPFQCLFSFISPPSTTTTL